MKRSPLLANVPSVLHFRKRRPPVGASPGTLAPAHGALAPRIHVISYSPGAITETDVSDVEDLRSCPTTEDVSWIDVQGLGDEAVLQRLGEIFSLHPLALEDAVNVPQRPKSELYEGQHLFITRMMQLAEGHDVEAEQVSIFIGPRYVLTLQERRGDVFDPVRVRIRAGKGLIRRQGPDYLAYALIDTVIDGYYPAIEAIGDRLHALEEVILERPSPNGLQEIHRIRRDLLSMRRAVWPQREAVNALIRDDSPFVTDTVRQYLRDSHDHAVQVADVIETYRELAGSLMDMYLSSMSQRTNEVMKLLTIMSSIFIPLTFLAGIYGMNFEAMPELHSPMAYPILLAVMAVITTAMVLYFRSKGWLGNGGATYREPDDDAPKDGRST